jgi:hypothetical protein
MGITYTPETELTESFLLRESGAKEG